MRGAALGLPSNVYPGRSDGTHEGPVSSGENTAVARTSRVLLLLAAQPSQAVRFDDIVPSKFALLIGVAPAEEQDLTRVRYQSLESTIIVDNSPMAYMFQPENAIDCIRCGGCCVSFLARLSVPPRRVFPLLCAV